MWSSRNELIDLISALKGKCHVTIWKQVLDFQVKVKLPSHCSLLLSYDFMYLLENSKRRKQLLYIFNNMHQKNIRRIAKIFGFRQKILYRPPILQIIQFVCKFPMNIINK